MERLNGGEFLLDLTPITIEESTDSETYTNITNAKVLEQLTNLKRYIPNEKAIKPVWVKFVNDETDEIVVVKGELAKTSGDEEFEIHVKTKGYELTIHIEFTQAVNENSDPIDDWYIDTNDAKYLFLSNAQVVGDAIANGDVDNAKPIYCHPIAFGHKVDNDNHFAITMLIFNNQADAFTFTTFKAWLSSLISLISNVRLLTSGYVTINGTRYPADYLFANESSVQIVAEPQAINESVKLLDLWTIWTTMTPIQFVDGVNKIN